MFTLTLSSCFGSPESPCENWLHISVVINWQLSKQGIRWPVSPDLIAGSGVYPSRSSIFWRYPLTSYWFQMIAGSLKFMWNVGFMSLWPSTINIVISNWPRTQEFSQLFKNTGGKDRCFSLFSPWSRVGHAPSPIFMRKIYAASWNLFTLTAVADKVLCQLVMFLTVFFLWMYKMKYSCYQEYSVIHGCWFVYWIFGWEMRHLSKSEIRFRMASFLFFTLLDA